MLLCLVVTVRAVVETFGRSSSFNEEAHPGGGRL